MPFLVQIMAYGLKSFLKNHTSLKLLNSHDTTA